jgi:hypothetical protein
MGYQYHNTHLRISSAYHWFWPLLLLLLLLPINQALNALWAVMLQRAAR